MTQLAAQQLAGIEKIKEWHTGAAAGGFADPFRLFGYAGTGKTTTAKEIPAALGLKNVVYGTYTGKAAHVLRSKGAGPVSTIHSAIYMPTTSAEAREALRAAREEMDNILTSGVVGSEPEATARLEELKMLIPTLEADARRMSWEFNPMGAWSGADLIILDEVSMVNAKLAADVESYGVPVLVLGDPAQLPPVEGGGYYTNATPDHLLTDVHRQALENPVLALATRIRNSTNRDLGLTPDDFTPQSVRHAMEHDQVLVWSNRRRWALVTSMRNLLGYPEGQPTAGDRIMCLTNNKDISVFNGQQFEVLASAEGRLGPTLTVRTEEGAERQIPCYADGFLGREMQDQAKQSGAGLKGSRMLATFAQAITVHKAQGSEWNSVYVVNETPAMISMTARRSGQTVAIEKGRQWMYTAATRARDTLTITAPRA